MSFWDVPDVLEELHTNRVSISGLRSVTSGPGLVDPQDFVFCSDSSVSVRLHALRLAFRALMYNLHSGFYSILFVISHRFKTLFLRHMIHL